MRQKPSKRTFSGTPGLTVWAAPGGPALAVFDSKGTFETDDADLADQIVAKRVVQVKETTPRAAVPATDDEE